MGQNLNIHTNHPAFSWLKTITTLNGRLFSFSLILSMYDYSSKCNKGTINVKVNMSSPCELEEVVEDGKILHLLHFQKFKDSQRKDNVKGNNFVEMENVLSINRKSV